MAKDSKIEWTDHTVNLWWGCTKVHEGCDNCYAETLSHRWGNDIWGEGKDRKRTKSAFKDLNKFQKKSSEAGIQKVFVGSMMDIFEKSKPLSNPTETFLTTGDLRDELFRRIDEGQYDKLKFLFLTKRPSNINKMIPKQWKDNPPANVVFGTSPVNQATFDNLIGHMNKVAGNKFLSIEPQLGEIKLHSVDDVGWIIQGGESGHGKRPFNIDWAYDLKSQCELLDVPYFFKQIDKVQEIPTDLLIKQFPKFSICELEIQ